MILIEWESNKYYTRKGAIAPHAQKNHQRVVPGLALCNSWPKQPILKREFSAIANPGDAPPFWSIANPPLHLD
ncbi:MAG: hypothetical protein ACM65L_03720 [Microcoleus sp.]